MAEKVLFVDDESAVLQGYVRLFRNEFEIDTSVTGKGALIAIETQGPYAVIVSDMRMPEMSGVEVLRRVKEISPDSIRIMLTGHADLSAAISAVNDGSIPSFPHQTLQQGNSGENPQRSSDAVPLGACRARTSRTNTQRQHRSTKRGLEHCEPRGV